MAKAFVFSDLHCSNKHLQNMYDFVIQKEIDAVISTGDIVNMGEPVWFMERFVKKIDELNVPLFWVPGNNDFGRAYYKLRAKYKSLEGRIAEFEGRKLTGVGGSPASWAGQYAGERMVDRHAISGSIFVSHVPPPGVFTWRKHDIPLAQEGQQGGRQLSDAPLLHICGHLHYRFGTAYLGCTKVVQLASLETGHYAILDLDSLAVEFKRFK